MKPISYKRIQNKIIRDSKKFLVRPFAVKKDYNLNKNHYIFADPRGGSTWLMEIIQNITNEPVIWEPLDLNLKNNPFNEINFDWRQYIPYDAKWPEAKVCFELLFQGKILEKNILDYSTFSQLNNSESLLFKICRGNALLPWLVENFEFKHKPVYMVRHPFAIASSQLRHGGWSHLSKTFEIPETPFNSHYKRHSHLLNSITTNEEILVAKWCLTNLHTLNHHNNDKKWITIYYEDFVLNPEQQVQKILDSWNLSYDTSLINFDKNSQTTHLDSPDLNIKKISSWQNKFNQYQIDKMGRILEYFNVHIYRKDSPLPKLD